MFYVPYAPTPGVPSAIGPPSGFVRHPGGDDGNAWALEFREWLVALGVPSHFITLEPASGGVDRLLILVETTHTAFDSSA